MKCKALLFDLGEVVIDVTHNFGDYAKNFQMDFESIYKHEAFSLLEKGSISYDQFRVMLFETFQFPFSEAEFDQVFDGVLEGVFPEVENFCEQTELPIYILSNTNHRHREIFEKYPVFRHFKECFYSCDMSLRKPDEAIYHQVLKKTGLKASEVLFLDDREENVEAAKKIGFQAELCRTRNGDFSRVIRQLCC